MLKISSHSRPLTLSHSSVLSIVHPVLFVGLVDGEARRSRCSSTVSHLGLSFHVHACVAVGVGGRVQHTHTITSGPTERENGREFQNYNKYTSVFNK